MRLARRLGLPRVETYHTFFEEYLYHYVPFLPRSWLQGAARRYSRRRCNEMDAVVVPSTAMHQRLREYGVVAPLEIIPTGIAMDDFHGGDGAAFAAATVSRRSGRYWSTSAASPSRRTSISYCACWRG